MAFSLSQSDLTPIIVVTTIFKSFEVQVADDESCVFHATPAFRFFSEGIEAPSEAIVETKERKKERKEKKNKS